MGNTYLNLILHELQDIKRYKKSNVPLGEWQSLQTRLFQSHQRSPPVIVSCDCLHRNGNCRSYWGQYQRGNNVLYICTCCSKYLIAYHIPDKSQLSMRFRSASTQKSFPSLLSITSATGRINPVVKSTSLSVPSRAARSILGARSCMLVKYMYLRTKAGAA